MLVTPAAVNKFAAMLQRLLESRGGDISALARDTGLSRVTVSRHLNGHMFPNYSTRRIYAAAFEMSIQDFEEMWKDRGPVVRSKGEKNGGIPVINKAPAGRAHDYEECFTDSGVGFEYIDRTPGLVGDDLFAFVVVGDSMSPEYQDGDYVVCNWVDPSEIEDGEAVFVRFGPEQKSRCTFKRARRIDAEHIELRADNPRYNPRIVAKSHIVRMAPVVEVRRRTKRKSNGRRLVAD